MQVDNSTPYFTTPVPQEDTHSTIPFPSLLLPLHGYHHRLSITAPAWPLPAFATHVTSLPAELIDMIQAFCSHKDLLALASVDKMALATRFCNPHLRKFCFKTVKDTQQFLAYCQALQEKEVEDRISEEEQKSHKRLKPALSPDPTLHFISFTQEHLQAIEALTLYEQFIAENYDLLFTYLPRIERLTIYSKLNNNSNLSALFKTAQRLNLHYLDVTHFNRPRDFNPVEDYLPDELWQLTTLETLIINNFQCIYSISEKIGQLKALRSLTLQDMPSLKALPASLWKLEKLEALTLNNLKSITALPEEMGQLKAIKVVELINMRRLKTLPEKLAQIVVRESW
jgi:hypothetical protein